MRPEIELPLAGVGTATETLADDARTSENGYRPAVPVLVHTNGNGARSAGSSASTNGNGTHGNGVTSIDPKQAQPLARKHVLRAPAVVRVARRETDAVAEGTREERSAE